MNNIIKNYEYLILIAMLYVAVDLSSMVFAYKIIEIGPFIGAACSLIFPLTYSFMDVIAEVYGYRLAKKIILYSFLCDFLFSTLVLLISHIPSPTEEQTAAYILILSPLLRAVLAQTIGVLSGSFANIYLISRWKIMTKGKHFWLRSIGSSTIGEAIMLIISVLIALSGVLSLSKMLQLILYAYLYKIIFAIIASPFLSITATFLKNKIGDYSDESNLNILNKQDLIANFQKS